MPDPLDTTVRDLFSPDPAHRRLLHHVVETVQLDQDLGFTDALERVHEAADAAIGNGESTLRGVFKHARGDAEYLAQSLTLLEQRDAAIVTVHKRATRPKKRPETDQFGRVRVGPKLRRQLDADGRLMSAKAFEQRLARARELDAKYGGDTGRDLFKAEDGMALGGGIDLVKTLELAAEDQAARAQAASVAKQLDQGIAAAADRRHELKLLDGQLEDLQGQREKLEAPAPGEAGLKLLDQGGAPKAKMGPGQLAKGARKIDKRVRKRMQRLGMPERDYVLALDAEVRGDPMPKAPNKTPDAPPGVNPGSHDLHRRIERYMLDRGLPASEYPKVLDQYTAGQVRL